MTHDVLLFASYADAFGVPTISVELGQDATVADLIAELRKCPGAHVLPNRPLVAVNHRYVASTARIAHGDELALIPPVAGG